MVDSFYLLGADVSSSPTPSMVNAAFQSMRVDGSYTPLNVAPADLLRAFSRLKDEGSRGFNVTMPHKSAVLGLLDSADPVSSKVGAVNTVSLEGGAYRGYNTDIDGIMRPLVARGVLRVSSAAVIGTGGVARAFCAAMAAMDCRRVTTLTRDPARALGFTSQMASAFPSVEFQAVQIGSRVRDDFELIFNGSPMGSKGLPLPASLGALVKPHHIVFDAVYSPPDTDLVKTGELRGSRVVRGHEMLLEQAISAVKIWTGRTPPAEVMRTVLLRTIEATAA
jgi:shikimate dehydrogenase